MDSTHLEGRVAAILNERELVINLGTNDGVVHGMRFAVLAASPLPIRDPETDEALGEVDREKVRVQVSQPDSRFAVCETYVVNVKGIGISLAAYTDLFERRQEVETLRFKDHPRPLSPEQSFINVGDRVRQVSDGLAKR